MIIYFI